MVPGSDAARWFPTCSPSRRITRCPPHSNFAPRKKTTPVEFFQSFPSTFHMSPPNQKPDLEDSINVTEAHGRVVREAAACAREKRIAATAPNRSRCGCSPPAASCRDRRRHSRAVREDFRLQRDLPRRIRPHSASRRRGFRPAAQGGTRRLHGQRAPKSIPSSATAATAPMPRATVPTSPPGRLRWVTGETERLAMIILNGLGRPHQHRQNLRARRHGRPRHRLTPRTSPAS
jgi:hypothetical protein